MIVLAVFTIFISAISFLLLLRDVAKNKDLYQLKEEPPKNYRFLSPWAIAYCTTMFLVTVAIAFLFATVYKENGLAVNLKALAMLSILWPIAYIDFKTYRIPNVFVGFGIVCRIGVLFFELFNDSMYVWHILISELIVSGMLLLAALLCSFCIKNSIGYGDIKLFFVMGLLLGVNGIWSAIFLSLIVSFVICAYVLISKKKTRKDAIPFAPALVIGTYLSLCLSGM